MHGVPSGEPRIKKGKRKKGKLWPQRPTPDLHLNQFYLNNIIHSPLISHLSFLAPTFPCMGVGLWMVWPPNMNMKEES